MMDDSLGIQEKSITTNLGFEYERNRDLSYIRSRTQLGYRKTSNAHDIYRRYTGQTLEEGFMGERLSLSNESEVILKGFLTEGNTLIENSIYLEITPREDLLISGKTLPETFWRNAEGSYFSSNTKLSQSFTIPGIIPTTLQVFVGLKSLVNHIGSLQNGASSFIPDPSVIIAEISETSRFTAFELVPNIGIKLSGSKGLGRYSVEIPIAADFQKVLETDNFVPTQNLFWISGIDLTYGFRPSAEWNISTRAGLRNEANSLLQYYSHRFVSSYRTTTALGTGNILTPDIKLHGALSLNYKDPFRQRSGSLSATYNHTQRRFISEQFLTETGILSTLKPGENNLKFLNTFLRFTQGVNDLHTVLGISAGYSYLGRSMIRNNKDFPYETHQLLVEPSALVSLLDDRASIRLEGRWDYTKSRLPDLEAGHTAQAFSVKSSITFSMLRGNAKIRTAFTGLWHNRDDSLKAYNFYPYLEAAALYEIPQIGCEISLEARNIFNRKGYFSTQTIGPDLTRSFISLRGREFLLGVRWRLGS